MATSPLQKILLRRKGKGNFFRDLRRRQRGGGGRAHSSSSKSDSPPKIPRAEGQIPTPNNVPTLPFWQRLGPLTRAAEAYARSQRKRPLTTQLCSSLVIYFASDRMYFSLSFEKRPGALSDDAREKECMEADKS